MCKMRRNTLLYIYILASKHRLSKHYKDIKTITYGKLINS